MSFETERRQHPRAEADFTLHLDAPPGDGGAILVKDISRAGVCCLLDQPIPVMTEVRMRLVIPDEDAGTSEVNCHGAVVRCDPLSEASRRTLPGRIQPPPPGSFEVAIFFLHVDEPDRKVIERYVDARLAQKAAGPTA